jgi:hypothetical protein
VRCAAVTAAIFQPPIRAELADDRGLQTVRLVEIARRAVAGPARQCARVAPRCRERALRGVELDVVHERVVGYFSR